MIAVLQEDARLLEATGEHIPLIESIEAVVSAFRVSLKKVNYQMNFFRSICARL